MRITRICLETLAATPLHTSAAMEPTSPRSPLPTRPAQDALQSFPPESAAAPKRVVLHLTGSQAADEKAWVETHTGRLVIAVPIGLIVAAIYYLVRQ